MSDLEPPDSHFLNAARGWLGLGLPEEARRELDRLSVAARPHPEALGVEWELQARQRNWEQALQIAVRLIDLHDSVPAGWINRSYALHELRRTDEAYATLLDSLAHFPSVGIIFYNLACYACQLGELKEARNWLRQAMVLDGRDVVLQRARTDSDLEPLRAELTTL